ncbi:hypothetical protein OPAG_09102 [Rhodococcus opacus PD630]|uniref:Uncharacterized protein n=1 Tax=Rhodococcus opacus TaxID=37919 RepID=A0A1B1K2J8_RHOOP|nr:hypothetical protein Pd630_LPD02500 [Rhodococcus opacus PD630]ANS26843.1 hypothetical protein R1CP_10650 [Rhodococcus opacus]EHI46052.1 hypothetical protein OPAG_09102 [Rhodococcus opacus PD630]MBA8959742.1 hypothetical protein [Rhodococcus opacus]CAG7604251.1 hypothetical protein E143388_05241 [Rhodococcus opacus]
MWLMVHRPTDMWGTAQLHVGHRPATCGAPPQRHVESLGRHAAEVFEVVGTVLYGLGT